MEKVAGNDRLRKLLKDLEITWPAIKDSHGADRLLLFLDGYSTGVHRSGADATLAFEAVEVAQRVHMAMVDVFIAQHAARLGRK
jgi:hypothetical protein